MHRIELVGIILLALLPLLAVLGVFGPASGEGQASGGQLQVRVEHPTLMRFQNLERLRIVVTNEGAESVQDIRIAIDPDYVEAFSGASFEPQPDQPYSFEVAELRPGEQRLFTTELTANEFGRHEGRLTFESPGAAGTAQFHTFVFP